MGSQDSDSRSGTAGGPDSETELHRLKAENAALRRALAERAENAAGATEARMQLLERAIALLPIGFLLVDPDDRIVLKNNRHHSFDETGVRDAPGTPFEEWLRFGISTGLYPEAQANVEKWVAERMARHRAPGDPLVLKDGSGRFIQIDERRSEDGFTVGTYTDVSDLKIAEAKLEEALRRESADNRAKSIFLANMSHELRTPLNAIIGFADLLLSDQAKKLPDTKVREFLEDILFAGRHLNTIISDILELSRAETGQYRIVKRPIELASQLEQVSRLFTAEAERRKIDLAVNLEPAIAGTLSADRRALSQMIINLVANSLRHTAPGGRITITVTRAGTATEITVEDTGSGIPADELDNVLKPFHRGRGAEAHDDVGYQGIGLGLAVTRELMESHGGRLRLESEEGVGTRATLVFDDEAVAATGRQAQAG